MQTFLQHARIHTETINKTFQKLGKQDSFKHILKISTSMYETSCSQFFRTTARIQLGPYTFDKSKFVMTFFTILRITEIFSFTWVLEGKAGKEIPDYSRLVFLEKFLAKILLYQMQKLGHWIEDVFQIYLCWEQYKKSAKSPKNHVSGKWWTLLFY